MFGLTKESRKYGRYERVKQKPYIGASQRVRDLAQKQKGLQSLSSPATGDKAA